MSYDKVNFTELLVGKNNFKFNNRHDKVYFNIVRKYFEDEQFRKKVKKYAKENNMSIKLLYLKEFNVHRLLDKNNDLLDMVSMLSIDYFSLSLTNLNINLNLFSNIRILKLHKCDISDVKPFENVWNLDLSYNSKITDVNPLKNVHILTLAHCYKITDVSSLSNIYELYLDFCYGVRDIGALGNVHKLSLIRCNQVRNISKLKNNKILNLTDCYNIEGLENLDNIQKLNLSSHCPQVINIKNNNKITKSLIELKTSDYTITEKFKNLKI